MSPFLLYRLPISLPVGTELNLSQIKVTLGLIREFDQLSVYLEQTSREGDIAVQVLNI